MPDNPNINQPNTGTGPTGTPGGAGSRGTAGNIGSTGAEGHGTHGGLGTPGGGTSGALGTTGGGTSGGGSTGAGTAPALAQQYGQKLTEAATQAKDYVADKVSVVGDKLKDLQNADLGELAENAKDYARKKPGQALLISAAVGLVLGLLVRGRR